MALRVWLPLNGNINNYGLSENLTQTNAPSYVDGKMGKAMSTGSLSMTAQQAKEVFNAKEMSFCFWIYVSSNWTGGRILFGNEGMTAPNNRKFSIFQYPNPDDLHLSWQTQASNGTDVLGIVYNDFFTLNAWTHTAITYEQQSKLVKIYKNGTLVQTHTCGTVYADGENFANATQVIANAGIRYLNDFRIYDHCLSPKEVKEVSKGLCLHYKLDGVCNTIDNIEWDCSGFRNNGIKNSSIASIDSLGRYSKAYSFNPSNKITASTGMPVGSNTIFTINFWLYIPSGKTFSQWGDFIGFSGSNIRLETSNTSASSLNWYNYPIGTAAGLTGFSLAKDVWNMVTLVCDGSKFIQYLNGSILANTNLSGTAFSTNGSIWIGDTSNMYFNISDLRIYATALSDADIKELYNTSLSIDNVGNMYTYEFKEIE